MKTPLLILSDSPSCTSGLGRITRDLATRIHAHLGAVYDIATIGYGGPGSARLPFHQYHIHDIANWLVPELPLVWNDFVGDRENGVLFVIWDASRVGWLADPRQCPIPHLRAWLEQTEMRKWIYPATDAEGPFGKLSVKLANTLKGFQRVINYSKFSSEVTGYPDYLPHGIDADKFSPHDRLQAKQAFRQGGFCGLKDDSLLVGIVATNQARKDYALGIQTCHELLNGHNLDVRVWIHTDAIERYWDIGALVADYHLEGRVVVTNANFTDEQMSWMYSACDVTLGIGMGEGFGYPLFESLASGTPVVHANYAGAAEHLPREMLSNPIGWRYEGPYTNKRPVCDRVEWAKIAASVVGKPAELPLRLRWGNLWPKWYEWFKKGLLR